MDRHRYGRLDEVAVEGHETIVEVPPKLMVNLANDGLLGEVIKLVSPIVYVLGNGNYVVKGNRVTDDEALGRMNIPDHETCVEVPKAAVAALIGG